MSFLPHRITSLSLHDPYKIFPVYIIIKQKPQNRHETEYFERQKSCKQSKQVKYHQHQESCQQLHIINSANDIEIKIRGLLESKFQGFCKMKAIGDNNSGMVFFQGYDYRFGIEQWVYFAVVDNHPDLQKAEKYLVFPGNNDIIRSFGQ